MSRLFIAFLILIICSCAHPTTRLPNINHYGHAEMQNVRRQLTKSAYNHNKEVANRLANINYRLTKSTGEELCSRKLAPDIGIVLARVKDFRKRRILDLRSKPEKDFDEDNAQIFQDYLNTVYVKIVVKDSPAEKAGVKPGDKLISLFGVPTPTDEDALEKINEQFKDNYKAALPINLEVERNNKNYSYTINPDMVCPFKIVVDETMHVVNAAADGDKIYVTIEAIDYIADDNILAGIIAHELAHNNMGHSKSLRTNRAIGGLLGFAIDIIFGTSGNTDELSKTGHNMYSKAFEMEADYVSTYYMARAGYDYKRMPEIQKKLADRDILSIYVDGESHPTPQLRYVLLKEAVNEIDLKKAFGEELLPNFNEVNDYLYDKKD